MSHILSYQIYTWYCKHLCLSPKFSKDFHRFSYHVNLYDSLRSILQCIFSAYGSTRSDISSAQRSGFHPISSTWKLDGLRDLRRPELQVSSDRRSVAQRGIEWCHAKNCMSGYNLRQFKQLLRCNMLHHVATILISLMSNSYLYHDRSFIVTVVMTIISTNH